MCQRLRSQCWLTGHRKRIEKGGEQKRTTSSKSTQLMGIQAIIKEMCVGVELASYISGLIGVIVFGYTFYKATLLKGIVII